MNNYNSGIKLKRVENYITESENQEYNTEEDKEEF